RGFRRVRLPAETQTRPLSIASPEPGVTLRALRVALCELLQVTPATVVVEQPDRDVGEHEIQGCLIFSRPWGQRGDLGKRLPIAKHGLFQNDLQQVPIADKKQKLSPAVQSVRRYRLALFDVYARLQLLSQRIVDASRTAPRKHLRIAVVITPGQEAVQLR